MSQGLDRGTTCLYCGEQRETRNYKRDRFCGHSCAMKYRHHGPKEF